MTEAEPKLVDRRRRTRLFGDGERRALRRGADRRGSRVMRFVATSPRAPARSGRPRSSSGALKATPQPTSRHDLPARRSVTGGSTSDSCAIWPMRNASPCVRTPTEQQAEAVLAHMTHHVDRSRKPRHPSGERAHHVRRGQHAERLDRVVDAGDVDEHERARVAVATRRFDGASCMFASKTGRSSSPVTSIEVDCVGHRHPVGSARARRAYTTPPFVSPPGPSRRSSRRTSVRRRRPRR